MINVTDSWFISSVVDESHSVDRHWSENSSRIEYQWLGRKDRTEYKLEIMFRVIHICASTKVM